MSDTSVVRSTLKRTAWKLKFLSLVERWISLLVVLVVLGGCSKKPSGSAEEQLLVVAVKSKGAASANALRSGSLCELAENHLDYMIAKDAISHDDYSSRNEKIVSLGGTKSGEIVAYNCGAGAVGSAATQCAESWQTSQGHSELMHQRWDAMCYQLKRSETGCWFCIGLFASGQIQ